MRSYYFSRTWKKDLGLGPTRDGLPTMALVSGCPSSMLPRSESRREGSCCLFSRLGGGEDLQILVRQVNQKFTSTIAT